MGIEIRDEPGGMRFLVLNRPPANALTPELLVELKEVVDAAASDSGVRAVIVRGNAKFFSAGLDLQRLASGAIDELVSIGTGDGIDALWRLPKPTIAAIEGHAIAGGAILALACDFRFTSRGTHRIGINENAFGIAFPRGAFEIARSALPPHLFGRILLEGALHSPEEALRLGLVHELLPDGESLRARVRELARKLASYPPAAYAYNKALIREEAVARCEAEPEERRRALAELWRSPETVEGIIGRLAAVKGQKN